MGELQQLPKGAAAGPNGLRNEHLRALVGTLTDAAAARVMDTDFAKETSSLTKNTILNQAAQSMVAQANQAQSAILAVLQ